jgi:hypothetical protein
LKVYDAYGQAQCLPGWIGTNVRFWHLADIQDPLINVRFQGKSRHRNYRAACSLLTLSGLQGRKTAVGSAVIQGGNTATTTMRKNFLIRDLYCI